MVSGNTIAAQNFDDFFNANYKKLYTHSLVQTHNREEAIDLLHTTYLKLKTYIVASGYTTTRFITYVCTSISNTFIDGKRKKKYEHVCDTVLETHEDENDSQELEDQQKDREYLCKYIFKYIENKYDEKQCYVFRVYYLYPKNERMTFQKISNQTGLGITYCSDTIKKIRNDVRINLHSYIRECNEKN